MKIAVQRIRGVIVGVDEIQQSLIDKLPVSEFIIDVKIKRNVDNHRRYFAFINRALDMIEGYTDKALRKAIIVEAGYFDAIVLPDGRTLLEAHSMSFDEMGEEEFCKLFEESIAAFYRIYASQMKITIPDTDWLKIEDFAR
jgi:hypothetical protein